MTYPRDSRSGGIRATAVSLVDVGAAQVADKGRSIKPNEEMAAGYQSLEASCASLEKEVQELNPALARGRWLQHRLGG